MIGRGATRAILLATCLALGVTRLPAQTVRIEGVTSVRYVQIRPLQEDSVPVDETSGDGLLRRTTDGRLVRCISGESFCRDYQAGARTSTLPGIQDLRLSGWGIARGVRTYAHLRARTDLAGGDELWPRSDDPFDVLAAYVELERERFRVRAGRDWRTSGLGYYNYDGASALFRATAAWTIEAYGGWSLIRGADFSLTDDALAAIEPLAPDERAVLLGVQVRYGSPRGLAVSGLYQREIRSDRLGLYSERAAFDAVYTLGRVSFDGSLEADLVSRQLNEARLDVRFVPAPPLSLGTFARRYQPFFELWTIWGAFSPVGFDEFGAEAFWRRPGAPLRVQFRASRRSYGETGAALVFAPLRTDGWRLAGSADLEIDPRWTARGSYHFELGSGAAISQGHLGARRAFGRESWAGISLTAFQRAYEFRVHEGTVYGVGLDGGYRLDARTRVTGSVALYRHDDPSGSSVVDWNQFRGSLRFEWTVGPEPGLARRSEDGS